LTRTIETALTRVLVAPSRIGGTHESLGWDRRDAFAVGPGRKAKIAIETPPFELVSVRVVPDSDEMGHIKWELKVESAADGLDYMRCYEVKVNAAAAVAAPA